MEDTGGPFAADAPPSSVIKCLRAVFVLGFGVLFLSCVCVSVSGVLFSVGLCVCDLLIFLQHPSAEIQTILSNSISHYILSGTLPALDHSFGRNSVASRQVKRP